MRDPFLDVIGVGGDGKLAQNIDEALYGPLLIKGKRRRSSKERRRRELNIELPDVCFLNARWPWEKSGHVQIVALSGVAKSARDEVAETARTLFAELGLPLQIYGDPEQLLSRELRRVIHRVTKGRRVDDEAFVYQLNQLRKTRTRLRRGFVLLFDPKAVDPFQKPGESQPGIYGSSHADGVCLLRFYHRAAVRHELAHMLGLGEHCPRPNCLMNWECSFQDFCGSCLRKIQKICKVRKRD